MSAAFADAVQEYRQQGDVAALLDRMKALSIAAEPEALIAASAPYHDLPEVVIPVYERVVAARPDDAQSMVILANAYWLTGRGADIVGALASRWVSAGESLARRTSATCCDTSVSKAKISLASPS